MKTLTLSEQLAEKYHVPTIGMHAAKGSRYRFIGSPFFIVRPLTMAEGKRLAAAVEAIGHVGVFGANHFRLKGTALEACKVSPGMEFNLGWRRNPMADHWEITDGNRVVFCTQNFGLVLRYFARKAGVI